MCFENRDTSCLGDYGCTTVAKNRTCPQEAPECSLRGECVAVGGLIPSSNNATLHCPQDSPVCLPLVSLFDVSCLFFILFFYFIFFNNSLCICLFLSFFVARSGVSMLPSKTNLVGWMSRVEAMTRGNVFDRGNPPQP